MTINRLKLEDPKLISQRAADWRCGAIVYQVLVDRFVPCQDLESKRHLYAAPKRLKEWTDQPRRGKFLNDHQVWSHEVEFWGGDLASVGTKLEYLVDLGIDVLYLNPIHHSFTNHKYGAMDYRKISPEFGTDTDLKNLIDSAHDQNLKFMLDGVFNHMGLRAEIFQDALSNPNSPFRDWFYFGDQYDHGYRAWYNVPNLPEVNLENPKVKEDIWDGENSVVNHFLKMGIDGWRLDVAYDIGPDLLREITDAAHKTKPGCCVVGEVWTDPVGWAESMDGLMNFNFRQLVFHMLHGKISGPQTGRILQRQIDSMDYDSLLRSWLILDNHDTPRLKALFAKQKDRRFAQTLQLTMPGAPCIYYGVEVGMAGGEDPDMRGPMEWDKTNDSNSEYRRFRKMISVRNELPALRYGSTRYLESEKLLAFVRYTSKTSETVLVVANPTDEKVIEIIAPEVPSLLTFTGLRDQFSNYQTAIYSGCVEVEIPARTVVVLTPHMETNGGYDSYKRIA